MHILQPKHHKLKESEAKELINKLNISVKQLPKIKLSDSALPEGAKVGDIIKIERNEDGVKSEYYRVVVSN